MGKSLIDKEEFNQLTSHPELVEGLDPVLTGQAKQKRTKENTLNQLKFKQLTCHPERNKTVIINRRPASCLRATNYNVVIHELHELHEFFFNFHFLITTIFSC